MKLSDYGRTTIVFQNNESAFMLPGFKDRRAIFQSYPNATQALYALRGEFVDESTIEGQHQIEIGLKYEPL